LGCTSYQRGESTSAQRSTHIVCERKDVQTAGVCDDDLQRVVTISSCSEPMDAFTRLAYRVRAGRSDGVHYCRAIPVYQQARPVVTLCSPCLKKDEADVRWCWEDLTTVASISRRTQLAALSSGPKTYYPLLLVINVLFNTYCTNALLFCDAAFALIASSGATR